MILDVEDDEAVAARDADDHRRRPRREAHGVLDEVQRARSRDRARARRRIGARLRFDAHLDVRRRAAGARRRRASGSRSSSTIGSPSRPRCARARAGATRARSSRCDVELDVAEEARARLGIVGGALVEQLGGAADRGERRLELVGDVGGEVGDVAQARVEPLASSCANALAELADLAARPTIGTTTSRSPRAIAARRRASLPSGREIDHASRSVTSAVKNERDARARG